MNDLPQRAKDFASQAHRRIDHRRKYTAKPYEVHLKAVAALVASVTDDPVMIAAAWLHDIVEDTPVTVQDVEAGFGPGVARLVAELTDVSRPSDGNRAARKAIDRAHTAGACARAKTVKLADLIDNCRDICAHDARFARTYLAEMLELLDVLGEGDERLHGKAREEAESCARRLGVPLPAGAAGQAEPAQGTVLRVLPQREARVLRLFARSVTAGDIAEPLLSFDEGHPAGDASRAMAAAGVEVAGVRRGGAVSGYLQLADAGEGPCGGCLRPFRTGESVEGDAPVSDVIEVLTRFDHCFVRLLGQAAGVIVRADIQKPLVRMWLFGLVTSAEIGFARRIDALWPEDGWVRLVTPERLAKAEALRAERHRRGQPCRLLDCLQLSDKAQILIEDDGERTALGFETKGAAKRVMREFESLRNNLAHAQDIVTHDWPQIVRLSRRIEDLLREASDRG